ncbi:unnamed protein product [Porites lobata]|uniref:Recombination activating protein 1 n=1 Tax=Porites lobata TaxID=104759 RepID=A0ABN8PKG9_9CNID|nr:unnamed protein product [Porites lobata]
MWTQHWPLSELRDVERAARKIIVENGGKHPASLTSLLYLPREKGGRGLRSVEQEYKITKIKSLLKLYQNPDQTVEAVREFEEHAMASGHQSLDCIKYICRYCLQCIQIFGAPPPSATIFSEPPLRVSKNFRSPPSISSSSPLVILNELSLSITSCFAWLKGWATCPTHTVVGVYELYEQLLPTKLYTKEKTQTSTDGEVLCRLCGKVAESVAHVLAGCSSLAQTKYLYRHNAALKILFFELLREHGLMEEVPPWYSPVMPKPA